VLNNCWDVGACCYRWRDSHLWWSFSTQCSCIPPI